MEKYERSGRCDERQIQRLAGDSDQFCPVPVRYQRHGLLIPLL